MSLTHRDLAQLADKWQSAEALDPEIVEEPLTRAAERSAAIRREAAEIAGRSKDAKEEVALRLARGEIDLSQALAEHAHVTFAEDEVKGSPRLTVVAKWAEKAVVREALAELRMMGDALLSHLAEKHDQIVKEATKLLPAVEGIAGPAEAMSKGPKAREHWVKLRDLADRRDEILDVHEALTQAGIIRGSSSHAIFCRRPELWPLRKGLPISPRRSADPVATLRRIIESGSEPTLRSADEAERTGELVR